MGYCLYFLPRGKVRLFTPGEGHRSTFYPGVKFVVYAIEIACERCKTFLWSFLYYGTITINIKDHPHPLKLSYLQRSAIIQTTEPDNKNQTTKPDNRTRQQNKTRNEHREGIIIIIVCVHLLVC